MALTSRSKLIGVTAFSAALVVGAGFAAASASHGVLDNVNRPAEDPGVTKQLLEQTTSTSTSLASNAPPSVTGAVVVTTDEPEGTEVDGTEVDGTEVDGTEVTDTEVTDTEVDDEASEATEVDDTEVDGTEVDDESSDHNTTGNHQSGDHHGGDNGDDNGGDGGDD